MLINWLNQTDFNSFYNLMRSRSLRICRFVTDWPTRKKSIRISLFVISSRHVHEENGVHSAWLMIAFNELDFFENVPNRIDSSAMLIITRVSIFF